MKTSVLRVFKDPLPISTAITKNWTGSLGKELWIFQACTTVSLYSLAGYEYIFVNGDLSLVNTAYFLLLHRPVYSLLLLGYTFPFAFKLKISLFYIYIYMPEKLIVCTQLMNQVIDKL